MRVGLALGGGGARGLAHIGVLEVLEREKICFDLISGTSMGAVIGALYAKEGNLAYLKEKIFSFLERDIIKELEEKFSLAQKGQLQQGPTVKKAFFFIREFYIWNIRIVKRWLIDYKPFEVLFKEALNGLKFSDCKIPFLCVAVDLLKGEEVYLEEGLLYEALLASCALPGVFPPLKLEGRYLVDGGVLEALPTLALRRKKVDFVIGINLERKRESKSLRSSMDILLSVDEIRHNKLIEYSKGLADFLFEPDTSGFAWADFSKVSQIVERGKDEALQKISQLKKRLRYRRLFSFFSKRG